MDAPNFLNGVLPFGSTSCFLHTIDELFISFKLNFLLRTGIARVVGGGADTTGRAVNFDWDETCFIQVFYFIKFYVLF